jgi:hypothetical protein
MSFLGGLFGRSKDRKDAATDRCMACGMTEGAHKDWCTSVAEAGTATPTAEAPAPGEALVEGSGRQGGTEIGDDA